MLTIKKGRRALQLLAVISVAGLTACGPPGPRDLRKGERLIAGGRYADAIPVLTEAVQLFRAASPHVQATAWNLLGLAYHGAGQQDAAAHAYLQALKFDRNLWAVDFNLGCLCLDEGNYAGAIDYFTTYTSAHQREAEGYLLLGRARLKLAMERPLTERNRQVQLDNARLDYEYAEKLHPTAEACNALGIIELLRRVPGTEPVKTSMDYFRLALQREPNYAPALLDLAVVLQRYANEPKDALDTYRQYLALQPAPPQAADVERVAHQLDVDLRITFIPRTTEHPTPPPAMMTPSNNNPPRVVQQPPAQTQPPPPKPAPPPATVVTPAPVEKPVTPRQVAKPPANPPPVVETHVQPPVQTPAPPVTQPSPPVETPKPQPEVATAEIPVAPAVEPRKSTFAQKLNPLNWFKSKKSETPEDLVSPETANIERYAYPLPVTPIPGDRKLAEQLTSAGQQSEHQSNLSEAMRDYQDALKADPTYFEPALALGLAAIDAKNYPTALDALGQALTLQANSADARYAFAWVLGRKGYYIDAANELNKLLAVHPQEVRAHLLLGNYYADNLDQPKLAREHYTKALELINPQTTQAAVIRAWLDQHP